MNKLNLIEQQKLIDFYNSDLSVTMAMCQRKFNVNQSYVTTLLKSRNITIKSWAECKGINSLKEKEIIEYHLSGHTGKECGELYNLSSTTIFNILKRNNIIERRHSSRKYFINEDYFEKIDSKDKAYFLGLLIADGNNTLKSCRIELQEEDKYILDRFSNYINFKGELYLRKKREGNLKRMYHLSLNSYKLTSDLNKIGCIPNKTHFAYFPDIEEKYWSHFIRGVFDGDGCIYINKKNKEKTISFVGNNLLIERIQEILMEKCFIKKTKLKSRIPNSQNIITFTIGGNRQIKRIGDYFYKDCEDLFLTRKKEKFK